MDERETISIGGASGYWGEAAHATAQLLGHQPLDFLVYDYLAEVTMSIMARARMKEPSAGYATDFVTAALAPNLDVIAERGIKVISNAGGVNPQACGEAIRKLLADKGISLKVAVITGDDLIDRVAEFADTTEMFSGETFPAIDRVVSINAYVGAFPIARALDKGADIVVTGRCVDSAVTLGACIHRFGWREDDFDLLAAGSLAGHLIECGPQATGGNFTDWKEAGDIAHIGYPVAEITADGSCVITKPDETTGVVTPLSVGEQMLYEIGDPASYKLPDVICDFRGVSLRQDLKDRVLITGAKGRAPTQEYKASATYLDGYRAGHTLIFNGFDSAEKAQTLAQAIVDRSREQLRSMNAPDFDEVSVEVFGGQNDEPACYGEVMLKLAARHGDARALGIFLKELSGIALATPAGMSVFAAGGRPRPSPIVRLFSFLIDKNEVSVSLSIDGASGEPVAVSNVVHNEQRTNDTSPPNASTAEGVLVDVPLVALAVARSGDKGDKANIGVMARQPDYLPWIWQALTPKDVAGIFADFLKGKVERYYLPGSHSINFLLDRVLGGGGIASLRQDAQGKGYAQRLLAYPVPVSQEVAANLRSDYLQI